MKKHFLRNKTAFTKDILCELNNEEVMDTSITNKMENEKKKKKQFEKNNLVD